MLIFRFISAKTDKGLKHALFFLPRIINMDYYEEGNFYHIQKQEDFIMKNWLVIGTMVALIIVGVAIADTTIPETTICENYLEETILNETLLNEAKEELKTEKVPNYVIEIGGDRFIDIKVNHHFGWITAIGDGVSTGWNATRDFCVNAGTTVANTTVNAYNATVNWIGGFFK